MKLDMEKIAEFLSSTLSTKTYDPDYFMKLVRENISELKKHGLYPAPSVVEGELPVDSNLVFSTINERHLTKNKVALQLLELQETLLEPSFNDPINVPAESNSTTSDKSTQSILAPNAHCIAENFARILPKVIPPPPNYPAPQPCQQPFIQGWNVPNNSTFKRNQRDKVKSLSRPDTSNKTQPIKSLYSETTNYFTDGLFVEEQQLAETSTNRPNNLITEGMGASSRSSANELQTMPHSDTTQNTLMATSNATPKKKKKKRILAAASVLIKSTRKTPTPKREIHSANLSVPKEMPASKPEIAENITKLSSGNDKINENSSYTTCSPPHKGSSLMATTESDTTLDSEDQLDDNNVDIDVDDMADKSRLSCANKIVFTHIGSSCGSSCSEESDSDSSTISKLSNNCKNT